MKSYYRLMLGRKSVYAEECHRGGFVGVQFVVDDDLSQTLPENWRDFNKAHIPTFMAAYPEKSKIAAGLACGGVWVVCKGMNKGDIVLSPNGDGQYLVGEVTGTYQFERNGVLPHRRPVTWYPETIERADMSEPLRNSTGSIGTISNITKHAKELEALLSGNRIESITTTDPTIEDPTVFALEKHLEDFLVANWRSTELGRKYDIFEEDGECVGQQFPSDTGPIDILAISRDKKEILVVELKKGRASDNVVGQIQRYMGYVLEELAEPNQSVRGIIIALNDDLRIRRALAVTNNIDFMRYEVQFQLIS